MNTDYYTSPKPSYLMRFLWKAAGADSYILEKCTYTDHVKYACLGGIVLATGVMAALAGGYAFYIIFSPKGQAINPETIESIDQSIDFGTALMSVIFGCIWGLIIFNIDRFIVASTGKGDGTEAITSAEIKAAIPRIIMGIIIAITISKPVELRMFKTEIDVKLQEEQDELYNDRIGTIKVKYNETIENAKTEINRLRSQTSESKSRLDDLKRQLLAEIGEGVGSGVAGDGPTAAAIRVQIADYQQEYELLKEENDRLLAIEENSLKDNEEKLKVALAKADATTDAYNGLNARLKIVHDIVSWEIILFITLLFMSIELTPIFFKMMLIKSPYDYLNDNIKGLVRAEKGIEIKYDFYKDKKGVHRDLIINHQSEKILKEKIRLLQAQSELNEIVVESWKNKEIKNIQKNPENYIDK